MRVFTIILVIVIMLFPMSGMADAKEAEFAYGNDIKLGMSMDEVMAIYGKPSLTYDSKLSYMNGIVFAGLPASIEFDFTNNQLTQVVLFFNLQSEDGNYVTDFELIDTFLLSQYPDEAYTGMSSWLNDDYADKENKEQAVKDGALVLMSDFKESEIEVQHFIQFIGTVPLHTVTFLPIK